MQPLDSYNESKFNRGTWGGGGGGMMRSERREGGA